MPTDNLIVSDEGGEVEEGQEATGSQQVRLRALAVTRLVGGSTHRGRVCQQA